MLQQTQVSRVIPKWESFLAQFPSAVSCADSEQAEVVRLWEGLGYHRRAVMLHRCATAIRDNHDGVVPTPLRELMKLPGLGPYTARAVRVFAYETDDAVLDTNVGRVLARALAGTKCSVKEAQTLADRLVPHDDGWAWNQGMLDLGAVVCTKLRPNCERCPVATICVWNRSDKAKDPLTDPAVGSAAVSVRQSRFHGSDRQGRGRMLAVLRKNPGGASHETLAVATGWADQDRVQRTLMSLVVDELVVVDGETVRLR
jgi:A/G-specific adenine glycosylase